MGARFALVVVLAAGALASPAAASQLADRNATGWKRENSFLVHKGTGTFCYGLFPHKPRPAGTGKRYRATVIGPGVTPDVFWEADAPGPYDRDLDRAANEEIRALGDPNCKPN